MLIGLGGLRGPDGLGGSVALPGLGGLRRPRAPAGLGRRGGVRRGLGGRHPAAAGATRVGGLEEQGGGGQPGFLVPLDGSGVRRGPVLGVLRVPGALGILRVPVGSGVLGVLLVPGVVGVLLVPGVLGVLLAPSVLGVLRVLGLPVGLGPSGGLLLALGLLRARVLLARFGVVGGRDRGLLVGGALPRVLLPLRARGLSGRGRVRRGLGGRRPAASAGGRGGPGGVVLAVPGGRCRGGRRGCRGWGHGALSGRRVARRTCGRAARSGSRVREHRSLRVRLAAPTAGLIRTSRDRGSARGGARFPDAAGVAVRTPGPVRGTRSRSEYPTSPARLQESCASRRVPDRRRRTGGGGRRAPAAPEEDRFRDATSDKSYTSLIRPPPLVWTTL